MTESDFDLYKMLASFTTNTIFGEHYHLNGQTCVTIVIFKATIHIKKKDTKGKGQTGVGGALSKWIQINDSDRN